MNKSSYFIAAALVALTACSQNKTENGDFKLSGTLASKTTKAFASQKTSVGTALAATTKTITHVMAINPRASNPKRFLSEVGADGSFSLPIQSGKPYVLVFIADNDGLKGNDMIAGILNFSATDDLDTLAPTSAGATDVGAVAIDGAAQKATPGATFNMSNFLEDIGLTASEAKYLGSIDSISLRAANPDVDSNGIIDINENLGLAQDWHIRATTKIGAAGPNAKFSDITDKFLDVTGTNVATFDFNLGSAYAVYPKTFSSVETCAASSGVSATLVAGCDFQIFDSAGASVSSAWTKSSYSNATFGSGTMFQWGPDYNLTSISTDDLPGSMGAPVTMVYTLSDGKTLTFSHVITRPKATLMQNGTIVPFLHLVTTATGTISAVKYAWKRFVSGSWVDATTTEVSLIVNPDGAHIMFYTEKTGTVQNGAFFKIPTTAATGTIIWATEATATASSIVLSGLNPSSFCSSAVSYDDNLGLRIFAGGIEANAGVTPCP